MTKKYIETFTFPKRNRIGIIPIFNLRIVKRTKRTSQSGHLRQEKKVTAVVGVVQVVALFDQFLENI